MLAFTLACIGQPAQSAAPVHDILIRGGTIYDGSGERPFVGDVAIDGDRISYVGSHLDATARTQIDAAGKAVSPGFINMLSWAVDSLMVDGRAPSDLKQGVTLEVFGEGTSMGPLNEEMKRRMRERQGDIRYQIDWTTLGEYLEGLQNRGISPNVASFIGATTARVYVLGERDLDPTQAQLDQMRELVRDAMQEGALGVGSSLIYVPATYAETPELTALAEEAGKCGGIYITHMRNEADHLLDAVQETIQIARRTGTPAEIYHLKAAGRKNWEKLDALIGKVTAARKSGVRITADMYTYAASATGLDASMPPWVQEGGLEAWIARMKDPDVRARVIAEMRSTDIDWPSAWHNAGSADGVLLTGFKTAKLKPLTGKTLAEAARMRGESPEETAIDLVIEDGSRIDVVYFSMSEDNVRRQIALPFVSFGSDAGAPAPQGIFLESGTHPRAYGNVARLLGKYVRDEQVISLQEAVRRLTSLPAGNLGLRERGTLKQGYFADVVVFDPATIQDHATYAAPHQYATGVSDVLVNGMIALREGEFTGAKSGRVVRGRGWEGWPEGGCRASSNDWSWGAL